MAEAAGYTIFPLRGTDLRYMEDFPAIPAVGPDEIWIETDLKASKTPIGVASYSQWF